MRMTLGGNDESFMVATTDGLGAMLEIISDTLKTGESLSLVGFGTFEVRSRAARTGRDPKTGEELKIKATKVPAFKPVDVSSMTRLRELEEEN